MPSYYGDKDHKISGKLPPRFEQGRGAIGGVINLCSIRGIDTYGVNNAVPKIREQVQAIGSSPAILSIIGGTLFIGEDYTFPSNIAVRGHRSGCFNVASGKTLTFNGGFLGDDNSQHFFGDGTIDIGGSESINVIWFGADPSGVDSSSAAIQKAMNAGKGKKGYVRIPYGTYRITTSIRVANPFTRLRVAGDVMTTLEVETGAAIVIGDDTTDVNGDYTKVDPDVFDVSFENLRFHQAANTYSIDLRLHGVERFNIRNCIFNNYDVEGVFIGPGCKHGRITQCEFILDTGDDGNKSLAIIGRVAGVGAGWDLPVDNQTFAIIQNFPTKYIDDIRVSNCLFKNGAFGIINSNARRTHISGCYFEGQTIRCINGTPFNFNTLVNDNIFEMGTSVSTAVNFENIGSNCVVQNNLFTGGTGGARDIHISRRVERSVIQGNIFQSSCDRNVIVSVASDAFIKGNTFLPTANSNLANILISALSFFDGAATHGDSVIGTMPGSIITENIFKNKDTGVRVQQHGTGANAANYANMSETAILNNVFIDRTIVNKRAMQFNTITGGTITFSEKNNHLFGSTTREERYVDNGTGTLTKSRTESYMAIFDVNWDGTQAPGSKSTITRIAGDLLKLSVTKPGASDPNTTDVYVQVTAHVSGLGIPVAIIPKGLNDDLSRVEFTGYGGASSNQYIVRFYDRAGVAIDMDVPTNLNFYVIAVIHEEI